MKISKQDLASGILPFLAVLGILFLASILGLILSLVKVMFGVNL